MNFRAALFRANGGKDSPSCSCLAFNYTSFYPATTQHFASYGAESRGGSTASSRRRGKPGACTSGEQQRFYVQGGSAAQSSGRGDGACGGALGRCCNLVAASYKPCQGHNRATSAPVVLVSLAPLCAHVLRQTNLSAALCPTRCLVTGIGCAKTQ